MTSPTPGPQGLAYPTRTKVIIVLVLALAIAAIVVAYLSTADRGEAGVQISGGDAVAGGTGERDPSGVEARIPPNGAQILGQETIGIDLVPGWTGELTLQQGNGDTVPLPEDEIVTDGLNRILYQPGPGRAIERLSGDYCILAQIWDQVEGREQTERIESWCFSAT